VRLVRLLGVLTAGVVALAGCAGDGDDDPAPGGAGASQQANSVSEDKPADVLAAAKTAAQKATSVRMVGELEAGGSSMKIDMVLSDDRGSKGSITIDGDAMELRQVGGDLYVKGSEDVWSSMVPGTSEAASRLDGAWVRMKKDDAAAARFVEITSIDKAFEGLLRPTGRDLEKVAGKDVEGTPTVGLLDKGDDPADAATLYIATRGPAYPLLVEPENASGRMAFTDWDADVTVKAPSGKPVDLADVIGR
jgi:hypothetical protein